MMPSLRVSRKNASSAAVSSTDVVAHAAAVLEKGVLGADAGVVQTRPKRCACSAICPCGVLQHVRVRAVQDARSAGGQRGGVVAEPRAAPAGFDADQLDRRIVEERGERADRIRAAADARDHAVRQAAELREDLRARLVADDRLEVRTISG